MHTTPLQALEGTRVLSLALNLPGPAALQRCRAMGAQCHKLEPLAPTGHASADPMAIYSPQAYAALHEGITIVQADLKSPEGQARLHQELADTDVLLTSFRPSALTKLGLDAATLHARYPRLCLVRIVGASGVHAEEAGHDLTYLAQSGLVTSTELPATLYADMGGSLMASEAVLQALLARARSGQGADLEVALADAAHWLALPRHWELTTPQADIGGAHAGYRIYPCADGLVALAALEPHFARRLWQAAGLPDDTDARAAHTQQAIAAFVQTQSCATLEALAQARDIPLHTLPAAPQPRG